MTAEEFVALLRGSNPIWHKTEFSGEPPRWIFRGHRVAAWRLRPQAWRSSDEGNPLHPLIEKLRRANVRNASGIEPGGSLHLGLAWTHAERAVLHEFRRLGWLMGFEVEEPEPPYRSYTLDPAYGFEVIDDMRDHSPFGPLYGNNDIGIAQHYGVPTRFLDWTFNPMFAVLFAAEEFVPERDDAGICVWALDSTAAGLMTKKMGQSSRTLMRVHVPQRRSNEFVRAQEGLLTEVDHEWALQYFERLGRWPSIEEVVEALLEEAEHDDDGNSIYDLDHTVLRRVLLPAEEVPRLQVILEREGLTRMKLMPTLENVAKAALKSVLRSGSAPSSR